MKILITGGGGLIGQAIAKAHINNGDEVYIYDSRVNEFNDYTSLVGKDITSCGDIYTVLKKYNFELISHQAAYVGVGESQRNIFKYVENNVGFTSALLDAIRNNIKTKPIRIILAGSMGPYGEGPYSCDNHGLVYPDRIESGDMACPLCGQDLLAMPVSEDHLLRPKSIYGFTKKSQEEMCFIFSELYNIQCISLRYFSVYGKNSNPINPYTGVLSVIANKILNSKEISIFEDGLQTRDLISNTDIGIAHLKASRAVLNKNTEAINIGTGVRRSLKEIAERMVFRLETKKELIFTNEYRRGDVRHSCACINKADALLNWKPFDHIDDEIENYCDFIEKNKFKYRIEYDTCDIEKKILKEMGLL